MTDEQTTEDARVSNATKTDEEGRISNATLDATEGSNLKSDPTSSLDDRAGENVGATNVRDQANQSAHILARLKRDDPDMAQQVDTEQDPQADEPKVFDEAYVQRLRDEAAGYRVKAKGADALAARLHTALVAATGKLADPTDLPFDTAHLEDDGVCLAQAIDDLLSSKPHLAARRVSGDVGQGSRNGTGTVDLLGMLRGH